MRALLDKIQDVNVRESIKRLQDAQPVIAVLNAGFANLVNGEVEIKAKQLTDRVGIEIHHQNVVGTPGILYPSNRVNGSGFTIESTSITDNSQVLWKLIGGINT